MAPITIVMLCFSVLGALDLIIGNKFGLGKQFENGMMLLGPMAMSMIGMIVLAPLIAYLLQPATEWITSIIPFEPSIIPGMLLANDMGGAPVASELATNEKVGYYNGLVVAAMMGVTVSYTLPLSMGVVKKEKHDSLMLGLLCGIVTVPIGCLVSGFMVALPLKDLLASLIPLFLFTGLVAVGLFLAPEVCLKGFKIFGNIIKAIIIIGLAIGIFEALTENDLVPYTASIGEGLEVCLFGAMFLSGAFPLMHIVSKLFGKPMEKLGQKIDINAKSALGLLTSLVSSTPMFSNMEGMDDKGIVINSAFAVSAGFVFGEHLAYTMTLNADFVFAVIVGKLLSGIAAVVVAILLYKMMNKKKTISLTNI